ncbi:cardiolipin synthase ClsB, partial [Citrobacter sp. AAK_AS5]
MSARAADPRDPHRIRLLHGGQEFFPALVVAMDRARSEVRLETYIFD